MKIWVDADACPKPAKELIFRAAERLQLETILVANATMRVPNSKHISFELVEGGLDVADDYIADNADSGDLVITADIPLAARVVDKGTACLDPRGQVFDAENVKSKLATRNLMSDLRNEGIMGGGPPPYKPKDRSNFASALDRTLTRLLRQ